MAKVLDDDILVIFSQIFQLHLAFTVFPSSGPVNLYCINTTDAAQHETLESYMFTNFELYKGKVQV